MSQDFDEKVNNFFKYFEIPELQNMHLLQSNKSTTEDADDADDVEQEENKEELSQAIAMSLEEDDNTKYDDDEEDIDLNTNSNIITHYNGNDNDDDSSHWTCPYCTYRNNSSVKVCEMCAMGDIDTINQQTLFEDNKTIITIDLSKQLNLETTIYLLFNYLDDTERSECLRIVSKTCNKLCDNISSWEKYGNLNYTKISQKLSKYDTRLFSINLFENAGFKKQDTVEKGERLIWNMDIENMMSLKKVVDILKLDEAYMRIYARALLSGNDHDETIKAINQIIQLRSGNIVCVCGKCHLKNNAV